MIDETIDRIIEKLIDINETMRNYICYQCAGKDTLLGCIDCYNCNKFEAKEGE